MSYRILLSSFTERIIRSRPTRISSRPDLIKAGPHQGRISSTKLSLEEFAFFLRCDGRTELIPENWPRKPEWAEQKDVIRYWEEGMVLLPEQEYFLFSNHKTDSMHLSLTGRCNFNCRHCFNARDIHPRSVEPRLDQLIDLLNQMDACGVGRLRLDGGEALTRPDFLCFTDEMSKRGIRLQELMTNGYLVTQALLDALEDQGHRPVWCVSFDGLNCHEWLRRVEGSEKAALRAIQLLCDRGFEVRVHQCVWKDSISSVRPTGWFPAWHFQVSPTPMGNTGETFIREISCRRCCRIHPSFDRSV